jgi:chromosome partitioning protein
MKIIAIANQKGGCAKTSTVVNLAAALGEKKFKILIIDLDPQANATFWLNAETNGICSSSLFSIDQKIKKLIVNTSANSVDIIPASEKLSDLTLSVSTNFEQLKQNLSFTELNYDFVILDTPPTLGFITQNALVACHKILIPVTTHILSLAGVYQLMQKVSFIQVKYNKNLSILGYVASRFDTRTRHAKDVLNSLIENFGDKVMETIIHENIRLAEAPSFQKSILEYAPNSKAARDYRDLAEEVIKKIVNVNAQNECTALQFIS